MICIVIHVTRDLCLNNIVVALQKHYIINILITMKYKFKDDVVW